MHTIIVTTSSSHAYWICGGYCIGKVNTRCLLLEQSVTVVVNYVALQELCNSCI